MEQHHYNLIKLFFFSVSPQDALKKGELPDDVEGSLSKAAVDIANAAKAAEKVIKANREAVAEMGIGSGCCC